jgi:hypothetical protein
MPRRYALVWCERAVQAHDRDVGVGGERRRRRWATATAVLAVSLTGVGIFATPAAAASIEVTPASAPAGVNVTVTGNGFPPVDACRLTLSSEASPTTSWTFACTTTIGADKTGSVEGTFAVPYDAPPGSYVVAVCVGLTCGRSVPAVTVASATVATHPFSVPAASLDAVTPSSQHAGGTISLAGSGFSPGGDCSVQLNGTPIGQCDVDPASGALSAQVTVPADATVGNRTVEVVNQLPADLPQEPAQPVQRASIGLVVLAAAQPTPTTAPSPTGPATSTDGSPVSYALVAGIGLAVLLVVAALVVWLRGRKPPDVERPPPAPRVRAEGDPGPPFEPVLHDVVGASRHVVRIEPGGVDRIDLTEERR